MWLKRTKTGKVCYCERYTDYITGKKKDVSITYDKDTARNRKEAQALLLKKIDAAQHPQPEDLTLGRLVDEYRRTQKMTVNPGTYIRNYYAMESIMRTLGRDVIVSHLTAVFVQTRFIEEDKDPSKINGHIKRLRALLRWAYKADLIESRRIIDKLEYVKDIPHREKITDKYMEADELRILLENMTSRRWALLTEFLALSGLRVGEATALLKSDIDLEHNVIHISKSFNPTSRTVVSAKTSASCGDVVIQPQLAAVIKRINTYMAEQSMLHRYRTDIFLCDDQGDYINYNAFNKYIKENTKRILGKQLTTHALRHTHASLLFQQGFTEDEVARRLRHSNSKITKEIYIHITEKLKEKDAAKLMAVNIL